MSEANYLKRSKLIVLFHCPRIHTLNVFAFNLPPRDPLPIKWLGRLASRCVNVATYTTFCVNLIIFYGIPGKNWRDAMVSMLFGGYVYKTNSDATILFYANVKICLPSWNLPVIGKMKTCQIPVTYEDAMNMRNAKHLNLQKDFYFYCDFYFVFKIAIFVIFIISNICWVSIWYSFCTI